MSDAVNIFGKPVKKVTLGVGIAGAAILGIGVYRYRRQQAAQAAAAANSAQDATGTAATDQVDPATGYPYGSTQDAAALATQAGYASPGGSGYPYPTSGGGGVYLNGGYPPPVQGGFTSNPQWAQAAEDYLVNVTQANPETVGNALGKYIVGTPVTADQQQIIDQAIAFEGIPPVPGPDGFPPSVRTAPAGNPPPGGGGGGGGGGTAPKTAPSGLSQTQHGNVTDFGWSPVSNATAYDFSLDGKVTSEKGNHAERVPVSKGKHTWKARGTNATGAGPWSASRQFTVR